MLSRQRHRLERGVPLLLWPPPGEIVVSRHTCARFRARFRALYAAVRAMRGVRARVMLRCAPLLAFAPTCASFSKMSVAL